MNTPLDYIPTKRRVRRKRRPAAPDAPAAALTLVAASLDLSAEPIVLLTFDRAVDVSAVVPAAVTVANADEPGRTYAGYGVDGQPTEQSVALLLEDAGAATPGATLLNASAGTGIVAVGDGAAW